MGSIEMRRADVDPLRALRPRDGIWVVSGNHEEIFGYDTWMLHYADMGMHVLANAHAVLRRGGGTLVLAGVNDRSALAESHRDPDLDAALAGAPWVRRSCCSTISPKMLHGQQPAVSRSNCPVIPTAA